MNGMLTKEASDTLLLLLMILIDFYVYLLKLKDETLHYIKTYKAEAENQLERKIKRLRFDHGVEYFK
jgi:hypothetical protein